MIDHCYDFAQAAKEQGRPIVGIMCEFTPRELILAAGGVPVCLCGGSAATIPAAEQFLPANLCPLIKSTFGYHVKGTNPFLQWADLVVAETTCDGKKKMFELLGETKPMYVLELPQKSDDPAALEHWVLELRKFQEYLEARFHVRITREKLLQAIQLMNRERALRRQLADLMTREDPPLTGRQLLEFKSIISGIEGDLRQYERALEGYGSVECRVSRGEAAPASGRLRAQPPGYGVPASAGGACAGEERGALPRALGLGSSLPAKAGTPYPEPCRDTPPASRSPLRILLTGVPLVHGAERVLELIENCGAVVVGMENCTGLKPILEDVEESEPDPIRALATKYYHLPCSVMTANQARFQSLRALAAKFRPDCVIELVWQACLTYDVESQRVRRLVEEELHLPYLKITTDYSPADSARITARVEALFEIVRQRTS